jgi:hypothetical protein
MNSMFFARIMNAMIHVKYFRKVNNRKYLVLKHFVTLEEKDSNNRFCMVLLSRYCTMLKNE